MARSQRTDEVAAKGAVIFDFDGTIADSLWVVVSIYEEMFGVSVPPEQVEEARDHPLSQVIKNLGIPLWKVPRLLTMGRRIMRARASEVQPFPGMKEVFEQLQQAGFSLQVMSSNSKATVQHFLEQYDLLQYFTHIQGSVGLFSKAMVLKKLMKQFGLTRDEILYVGDEGRDIDGAKKAHVPIISVGWGYNSPKLLQSMRPDYFVAEPAQILEAVEAWQKR
jgi:HAD superfamily hydrolase (TIGR01549 family)